MLPLLSLQMNDDIHTTAKRENVRAQVRCRAQSHSFGFGIVIAVGVLLSLSLTAAWSAPSPADGLIICSSPDNDLYQILLKNGLDCQRFDLPDKAIKSAPTDSGVLLLAEGYPKQPTQLTGSLLAEAKLKHLRLYVEFPASLPDLQIGHPRQLQWGRAVVTSDVFGPDLKRLRILDLRDCKFVPVSAPTSHLTPQIVLGRVAGFDTAVFGPPAPAYPLLFEAPQGNLLVATTKLSQFMTSRYAPPDAWAPIWKYILHWLNPKLQIQELHWTPTVQPSYGRNADLPKDYEREALERGVAWFKNSHLLTPVSGEQEILQHAASGVLTPPPFDSPIGDGSLGIGQGFNSTFLPDGRQLQSIVRRSDCIAESAMAIAFGAKSQGQKSDAEIARNLLDFLYFKSDARKREYANPTNGAYGLIAWGIDNEAWFKATYGDDEARVLFGTMAASALLNQHRWDKATLQCLLADLRTTGRLGFRGRRIEVKPLTQLGWQHFFDQTNTDFAPHYQSYLWAAYLWAWHVTGFDLFRERAETAIRLTMAAYPDHWSLVTGLQEERARMLLPLAWLVRVDNTAEHRAWLKLIATDLLASQDASGALPEEFSRRGSQPKSNAAYGTTEATLLQQNGDPVCDLLYTMNFAFLGLHEASAATGDPFYSHAEDRVAQFLCRIQIKSKAHPELDGGWYRAFDFKRWEYWASSSDKGWGAWSIESGWTQSWICSTLAMRQLHTSLWDLGDKSGIRKYLPQLRPIMIPDDALTTASISSEHEISDKKGK